MRKCCVIDDRALNEFGKVGFFFFENKIFFFFRGKKNFPTFCLISQDFYSDKSKFIKVFSSFKSKNNFEKIF